MLTRRFILAAAAASAAAAALPAGAVAPSPAPPMPPARTWYAILWDEHAVMRPAGSAEEAVLDWLEEQTGRRACETPEAGEDCACEFCNDRAQILDVYHEPSVDGREEVTKHDYYNAGFGVCCQGCDEPYAFKEQGGAIVDGDILCEDCADEVRRQAERDAEAAAEDAAAIARQIATRVITGESKPEAARG